MGSGMYLTVSYCMLPSLHRSVCIAVRYHSLKSWSRQTSIVCNHFVSKVNLIIRSDNAAIIALFRIYLLLGSYFMGRSACREGFAAQAI